MIIKVIDRDFSVCKVENYLQVNLCAEYVFIGKTNEENSLVCETRLVPSNTIKREDNWRAFKIEGELDFSLVGILAKISTLLANGNIGIFAVSTYNTDYIFVKTENLLSALSILKNNGYNIIK